MVCDEMYAFKGWGGVCRLGLRGGGVGLAHSSIDSQTFRQAWLVSTLQLESFVTIHMQRMSCSQAAVHCRMRHIF